MLRNVALERDPGTKVEYSNFGYVLLGRVIEQVAGRPYAEVMRDDVFAPAGANSFAPARRTPLADEATYTHLGGAPHAGPLDRLDSVGAWVATPMDLLRVAVRVDGFASVPDLLGADALATMTAPSGLRSRYAKGWFVNDVPNWWHGGYLPGSASLLVRTADRYGPTGRDAYTWAIVTNTTHTDWAQDLDLDALMWQVVSSVATWPPV